MQKYGVTDKSIVVKKWQQMHVVLKLQGWLQNV